MSNALAFKPIPLSEPTLSPNAWAYVKDALDSGWVSSVGPYVDRFEREFADYFKVPKTVATVNGTAALHIALLLAGVQAGDEVIVPSLTFIATINAIRYVGAVPVFWDSKADHWNADASQLEALVTPKTKAIMAVHLYGDAMDMAPVLAVAKRYRLKVIEDAAEALGAEWQGERCGRIADIGCLSFNGNKTVTTGGGGLLISRDAALMEKAHYLINQAKDDALNFVHDEIGYNYRLTNLQAALGVSQLECLPEYLEKRREIGRRYQEALAGHPLLTRFQPLPDTYSSCWLYSIALNAERLPHRTALDMVKALSALGIQSRPLFRPGHMQKPFLPFVKTALPHAEHWHQFGFNLPSSASLKADEQDRVIQSVLDILHQWEDA
jgi:perosamine synthetase